MKTLFKVLGIIIVVILFLMLVLPLLFHKQIMDAAVAEANKQMDAKIEYTDYGLSLFRSFPNFNLQVEELSVSNEGEFEGDTLAYIEAFEITIDLFSVFGDDAYEVKEIIINNARVRLLVDEQGNANWDIAKSDTLQEETPAQEEPGTNMVISIEDFIINNSTLVYEDKEGNMLVMLEGLDHTFSGDLSTDFTNLDTRTSISNLRFIYDDVTYMNNVHAELDAKIDADLKNSIYTLKENELILNDLVLNFAGTVGMLEEGYNLNLTFDTPENNFRELLSLVPAIYSKNFENIETAGDFSLDGSVKGVYEEDHLPAFDVRMNVNDAMFKYPDLPSAVNNIRIDALVSNSGGDADNTVIDVRSFHMEMAGNPFNAKLLVRTPVSDPYIDAEINGRIDLANVSKVYPLEEEQQLTGEIRADISMKGSMSSIENEQYEDFQAMGSMLVSDFRYAGEEIEEPLLIKSAQMNFSPQYLDLVNFNSSIGRSNIKASGKLTNYMAYVLSDGVIQGQLQANSDYINLNDIMPEEEAVQQDTLAGEQQTAESDTAAFGIVKVPENVDFVFNADIKTLIFEDMELQNVQGTVIVRDQAVMLENLTAGLLGGEFAVSGKYSTLNEPMAEMSMNISNFNIESTYDAFSIVQQYAPFAKNSSGEMSADLSFSSLLQQDFTPVFSSMNGSGGLKTSRITINNLNTFDEIQDKLNLDIFRNAVIDKIDLDFDIVEGRLQVKPFDFEIGDTDVTLGGWTSFDQSIEYTMALAVPTGAVGDQANSAINDMLSNAGLGGDVDLGNTVPLSIGIGGTLSNPVISADLAGSFGSISKNIKDEVKEQFDKKKEEVIEDVKEDAQKILNDANARAEEIINQARQKADQLKQQAENTAAQLRSEADKRADQLVAEGKKKGILAETAAKKAAQEVRQEADNKANQLIQEADKQAQNIINEAEQRADQIRNEAQQKIDR